MRALSALPQCGQVTPSGQRIASKYARALRSSVKIGSERFKDIGKPRLSETHPTSCATFVKVIIPLYTYIEARIMTTPAQIAANRRNARKSTGPVTEAGKAAASQNALRHGLTARQIASTDERSADFAEFAAALRCDLAPEGEVEEQA